MDILNRRGGWRLFEKVFFFFLSCKCIFFFYLERGGFKFLRRAVRGSSSTVRESSPNTRD